MGLTFLSLNRQVIRERGGASRHLERSELAFNIKRDNPIVGSKWDWENRFEEGYWRTGSTTREQMKVLMFSFQPVM